LGVLVLPKESLRGLWSRALRLKRLITLLVMGLVYFTHRQFPVGRAGSSEGIPAGDSGPGHLDYKGS